MGFSQYKLRLNVQWVMEVTYTRTSFLLSLGWNLTLKLLVVTSPGYFLSSRFSWSSSSPSEEVYEGAAYSTWREVKRAAVSTGKHTVWDSSLSFDLSVFSRSDVILVGWQYLFVVFLFNSTWFSEVQRPLPLWLSVALRQGGSDVLRGWRWGGWRLWRLHALPLGLLHAEIQGAILIHFNVRLLQFGHTVGAHEVIENVRVLCVDWRPVYLGAGFPGLGTEGLWSLPAAGGQVEDGCCCHVGCLCILAVVITTGGCGALRKASWHTLSGGGGLRKWFSCVGMEQKEFIGRRTRGQKHCLA